MKKILTTIALIATLTTLTGCNYNKQIVDLDYNYNYAIIERYDGEQKIAIKSWRDYENSDMVQITLEDGSVYLTHSSRIILVKE